MNVVGNRQAPARKLGGVLSEGGDRCGLIDEPPDRWPACRNPGLYSYGLYSCGLYSCGLYSYGLYSYGLYSYGPPVGTQAAPDHVRWRSPRSASWHAVTSNVRVKPLRNLRRMCMSIGAPSARCAGGTMPSGCHSTCSTGSERGSFLSEHGNGERRGLRRVRGSIGAGPSIRPRSGAPLSPFKSVQAPRRSPSACSEI